MPELPEVETIGRCLKRRLVGSAIASAAVLWPRTVASSPADPFRRAVRGARIARVSRRGKYLVFALERRDCAAGFLVSHLRMSGRWVLARKSDGASAHVRVRFDLDDGRRLLFVDPRKFGRMWHVMSVAEIFSRLGPEPLGPDFTARFFARELRRHRRRLKPLLLDQSFVAGLGNIYVDESLHAARLHPLARADRISAAASRRLHAAIRRTLAAAIHREGSSFDGFYRTPEGRAGRFQNRFRVYNRAGEPCRRCGAAIRRIVVAQRGTHLCPTCQPEPGKRARKRLKAP